MNELDLLLKELDKASSRPKQAVPRSGSAKGPLSGMQRPDGGSDSRRPSAFGAGSSSERPEGKELDGLVKDLTDLKGLVGGKEPAPAPRATRPVAKLDDNHTRAAEATSQLDRLMGDLSVAVGDLGSRGPSPDRPAPPAIGRAMPVQAPGAYDHGSTYSNIQHNAADPYREPQRTTVTPPSGPPAPTPASAETPLTTQGSSDVTPRGPPAVREQIQSIDERAVENEQQHRREDSMPQNGESIAQSASTVLISEGRRSPEQPTPRSTNLNSSQTTRDAINRNSFGAPSPLPARDVHVPDNTSSRNTSAPSGITASPSAQNVRSGTQTPPQSRGSAPLIDIGGPPPASGTKTCAACAGALSGPIVNAMGRTYHPEHFKCKECNRQLGHGRFYEKEGNPFCEACWQKNLPKCGYCSGFIMERCITALGQHWHPHHFFCAQCGKLFPPGAGFLEKDGMAYCEDDYFNLFAMRCGGCGKGIIGEFVSACGKEWHMPCFVCADCKENFPTGVFYEHHGLPYCAKHHAVRRGNRTAAEVPALQDAFF
ncbi:hypothetical protein HDU87_005818 [Geranomyces variabilis]|uniref:LIM zinc-binding domain-containing protein n=1 Tax=Geranomyces variabilis TaxID=109894 RepID=A0AAD5TIL1_9FUNG|nr:hypothetical protein HDU87_005818 [Geranomyces variabilis]